MLKILYARFHQYVNQNLQIYKLDLEKAEEPEIILKKSVGSQKKQENSRKKHLLLIHWLRYRPWLCLLQFTRSVVSNSVTPWTAACQESLSIINSWGCSNSCPLIRWCHPTTSHSVIPSSSCLHFQHQGHLHWVSSSYQVANIGDLASVLSMNGQGWYPVGLTSLISLLSKGFSRVFSNTTVQKHHFFHAQLSLWSNSHIHTWLLEKAYLWLHRTLSASNVSAF